MKLLRLFGVLFSLAFTIVFGGLMLTTMISVYWDEMTAQRSVDKPAIYCQYAINVGAIVYEYEYLNTKEVLTDKGELFNADVCIPWEDYHGKK